MAFLSNLHTHTTFSDGMHAAEEYITAALEKGFASIGFSEHAYTEFDEGPCIQPARIPAYIAEINRLKERYRGEIEIYTGMEAEGCYPLDRAPLDFIIGSVHFVYDRRDGTYFTIDWLPEYYEKACDAYGGVEEMVTAYYAMVVEMARTVRPEMIGHLDLVTKLNRNNCYFDPRSPWYRRLMERTADGLMGTGCIVEVNTGGISRGHQTVPNPAGDFLSLLYKREVPVTISSDAHQTGHLDYSFGMAEEIIREAGYRSVKQLRDGVFCNVPLYSCRT